MSAPPGMKRPTTNTSASAFNNIGKEARWAEDVEMGERAHKISLVSLLAGSSALLVCIVVVIALTPMATFWMRSVTDLSGVAKTSSLQQIDRYRTLIVDKAKSNVTEKLNQPVRAVRMLGSLLPVSFFAGNLTEVVAYAHSVVPSVDALYPGTNAILVPWTNQYGVHEFETKWSSSRSYALLENERRTGLGPLTFYHYDTNANPLGVPTGESVQNYNPSLRSWYIDGLNPKKTVNGIAWTKPTISKLAGDGMLVFCTLNVNKTGMPAGSTSVIAITMAIGSLIQFFNDLKLTANGRVFLMGTDLGLIAGSGGMLTINATLQASINATRSPDPDVAAAVLQWLAVTGGVREPAHFLYAEPGDGGQKYVDVERVEVEGLVWWLVLLTPSSDFMSDILDANAGAKASATRTLSIVIGVEVFVMCAVLAMTITLAWRLGKSLTKVTAQLQQITDMQFTGMKRVNSISSSIEEIFQLEVKTAKMSIAMQSFGKYVPKKVVRFIVQNNLEADVGICKAHATVFFLDIVDFTKSMQQYGVSIIVGVLNELFEEFSSIIVSHGANIDKYIGDSIMAIWGCPEKVDNAEMRACEAVFEIVGALNKKNERFLKDNGFRVGIRIGFHSGPVYAGNVGSSSRLNYTVLGDTVNLAARLEPLNKEIGTNIATTDSVRHMAEGTFAFRALLNISVRGFNEPVLVHEPSTRS
eukprot:m51a1_g12767 hypothetical protein (697) ;mRNA; f:1249-3559